MWYIDRKLSEFAWERDPKPRTYEECHQMMRRFPRYMRAVFVCSE